MNNNPRIRMLLFVVPFLCWCILTHADDAVVIRKSVQRSTLDQSGTNPFHLRAEIAPSRESDQNSGRTGTVEIWWASPTQWKREVRSPDFHQIDIVNGPGEWQRNEGDYFPEWLREVAVALINPVPDLDGVLRQIDGGDIKKIAGMTHFSWLMDSTNGSVRMGLGGALAITDSSGLLSYGSGFGWGALLRDFKSFHGRMIARTLTSGSPEVTATVTVLEDLGETSTDFFNANAPDGDTKALQTVLVDETALRMNLLSEDSVHWPPVKDGPLDGALTTEVAIDRGGKVRQIGTIVSNNPNLSVAARKEIASMQFKPYMENGIPVQVVSRITMGFKTVRPAGVENFDSARAYFERGREVSTPAAGNGPPYTLRAEFNAKLRSGSGETGKYVDTWKSQEHWRREGWIGSSHYVRSRDGEKRFQFSEGPDAGLIQLVFRLIEPIPTLDTFVESDWRMKREMVEGTSTIRVLTGYEGPDGKLDPEHARGYWFDSSGHLVKTYFRGIETRRTAFKDFQATQIPRQIVAMYNGTPAIVIQVTEITAVGSVPDSIFDVPGHEWQRAFTDEER